MTVYADERPVTTRDVVLEMGLLMPESPAEYVAVLIERGAWAEAYEVQQRQINEGRMAAHNGECYCAAWPIARRIGYVEALQDMEH
jgi:hypothetical protein